MKMADDIRPMIGLDVDGVLNPYVARPPQQPEGYVTRDITPSGFLKPVRVWLSPAHGKLLTTFADQLGVDLYWATTWEEEANTYIAPVLGLPDLPVIKFGLGLTGSRWKWADVFQAALDRPLVWFDDDFDGRWHRSGRERFLADRTELGLDTLLMNIDPAVGLTEADLANAAHWLMSRGLTTPMAGDVADLSDYPRLRATMLAPTTE